MLRFAVAIGAVCAARALTLHSGDELRSSDDDPLSPDHRSFIEREDASSARMLAEAIMREEEYVEDDYPALRLAARQGFVNSVRQLLELGASANVRFDVDGFGDDATPLHVAAHFGRGKIIELLVRDGGADVEARMVDPYTSDTYDYYKTALCVALDRNHTRTARTLLRLGANFTKPCPSPEDDANDWTPLLLAAEKANVEVVADLLQRTAPPRGKVLVDEILDDAAARQSELETSLTARQAEIVRLKEILKAQHREIPDAYLCPITMDPMEDPVIAADGHSYEKSEINAWFARGNNTSPKTGAQLEDTRLFPNHNLRNAIQNFLAEVRQFDCEL